MKEIDIIEPYSKILENYRNNNSGMHQQDYKIITVCRLCGATIKGNEFSEHMQAHTLRPPANVAYQLSLPFRTVNKLISKGEMYIKLLVINYDKSKIEYPHGESIVTPYNALNLKDWAKVVDTDGVTIRWNANKKKFIKTLW